LFWFTTGECRTLRDDNYRLERIRREEKSSDYLSDGAGIDEDEDESQDGSAEAVGNSLPVIQTSGLVVETIEGTTVNLPCKVINGSSKYRKI
jgi:hypothetical protein